MIDIREKNWLQQLLPSVITLAREAGREILTIYGEANPSVTYKPDSSPLTHADLASHRVLITGLSLLSPEWPVLSEESTEIPFDQRQAWQYFWMVDPLDGTKDFLHRNGEFTVNIALMAETVPVLGVVFAPVIDKLYFAAKGIGAYRIDGNVITQIKATRATSSTVRMVVSRSHQAQLEDLTAFAAHGSKCEFIPMGSSLKFCLIAEGAADLYPRTGPTMEWDTAAAQCILEEAGGLVTDLDGNSMVYNKPTLLNSAFLARGAV
jgi:3'(2'), 5'-bisphosphate nucleotidase